MLVCMVLAEPALERGATMATCATFLAQLAWKDFEEFMNKHCQFAQLTPGRALWVPYGWRSILVSRTAMSHSHALYIPYVNTRMLMTCSIKEEVITIANLAMQEWAKLMKQELCTSLAKEATSWLEQVSVMRDIP